MDFFL